MENSNYIAFNVKTGILGGISPNVSGDIFYWDFAAKE